MELLLKDLFYKAYKNNLIFNYHPSAEGFISIYQIEGDVLIEISEGYTKSDWIEEPVESVLKRMHQEVDEYINPPVYIVETKKTHSMESENERKMKGAGHKESDFA